MEPDDPGGFRLLADVFGRGLKPTGPVRFIHHGGFVAFLNRFVAMFADIGDRLRASLVPFQPFELQPLKPAAMGTGDVIAVLIACFEFLFDPA